MGATLAKYIIEQAQHGERDQGRLRATQSASLQQVARDFVSIRAGARVDTAISQVTRGLEEGRSPYGYERKLQAGAKLEHGLVEGRCAVPVIG